MASSNLATYITRNAPSVCLMRISFVPAPTSSKGIQSSGSSPRCTLRSWYPAGRRASSGKISSSHKSLNEDPIQSIGLFLGTVMIVSILVHFLGEPGSGRQA